MPTTKQPTERNVLPDTLYFPPEAVRCMFFAGQLPGGAPSGKQVSAWLPEGNYRVIGLEVIEYSDLGQLRTAEAVRIESEGAAVYYLGEPSLKVGQTVTRKPDSAADPSAMRLAIFAYHVASIMGEKAPSSFSLHPVPGVDVRVRIDQQEQCTINGRAVGNRWGAVDAYAAIVREASPVVSFE